MRSVQPDGLIDAGEIGYSQAVVTDDGRVFCSGQVGWDESFEMAGDDLESQARRAFENVEILLAEVDRDLDGVAKVTSYLVDPDAHLERYLEVWSEVFSEEPYPAHTIVGVDSLARPEFLVEIDVEP